MHIISQRIVQQITQQRRLVQMLEPLVTVHRILLEYDCASIDGRVVLCFATAVANIPSLLRDGRGENAEDVATEEVFIVDQLGVSLVGFTILAVEERLGRRHQDDIILGREGVS